MLYPSTTLKTTTVIPRVVDTHSLLHLRVPKSTMAVDAADAMDGLIVFGNLTFRLSAFAYGVSVGSVVRARRLSLEERQEVRDGGRPLVLPHTLPTPPAPSFAPVSSTMMGVEKLLAAIVEKIGTNGVLDLLAASERVTAA